eukprot:253225-Alexandrium_andersonii.AAC.1
MLWGDVGQDFAYPSAPPYVGAPKACYGQLYAPVPHTIGDQLRHKDSRSLLYMDHVQVGKQ